MYTVLPGQNVPIKAWVKNVPFEPEARQQLQDLAMLPFIYKWLAVMPDVHAGKGSTVGTVIATDRAIIPAAVGVDIGCGMCAVKTTLTAEQLPDSLKAIRDEIEIAIPVGFGVHKESEQVVRRWTCGVQAGCVNIIDKHPGIRPKNPGTPMLQLGTLGGGNHFIELCLDESGAVWVMLHSGSRGIGNRIGAYFIEKAKEEMQRWHIWLPDSDLAYLPEGSQYFNDYVEAVHWAQSYAMENRKVMLNLVLEALGKHLPPFTLEQAVINCHHNYVERENHFGKNVLVTRKGAVRAREGDLGIIPGSMGAKSYIVRGKGNPESFCSCSHGAGRAMSRNEAKRRFTVADQVRLTEGIECRKDEDVLDEIPSAYKDIDAVMMAQADLVEVVHTLKQVLCVKG